MKIYSDTLTVSGIATEAHRAGAYLEDYDLGPARKRAQRIDVWLSGSSPHASAHDSSVKGASWDEWGMLLAALWRLDPNMTTQYYADAEEFHGVTRNRFRTLKPADQHRRHRWAYDPESKESRCECGARTVWSAKHAAAVGVEVVAA